MLFERRFFFCVSCMKLAKGKVSKNSRESFNCNNCEVTARERAVILGVKKARRRLLVRAFEKKITILGVADGERTQAAFKRKYNVFIEYSYS